MVLVIIAGIVYALWFDSIPAAILTAGLILYRARRPSQMRQRWQDFMYARQAMQVGDDDPVA